MASAAQAVALRMPSHWRPLRARDVDYVAALEAQIHAAPWTAGNFRDALAAGYSALVGEREGRIVAFGVHDAGARRGADPQSVRRARCATRRAWAASSCGASSTIAARFGAEQVFLEVRVGNAAAIALYEAEGFVRVARRARLLPAPTPTARARTRSSCAATLGRRALDAAVTATRDDVLRELGLCCRAWRLRALGRAGASRAGMPRRATDGSPRAHRTLSLARASPPTSTRARRAACAARARDGARASATRPRNGCSSARRRAPRKTRAASPSSARRAACSTTCWRRSAWTRERNVYIANVLKCRPPNNRTPEPLRSRACRPYLERQVALLAPKLIVALGQSAASLLLGTDATIASLRGRVHRYRGMPLVVTYHPAYLLRNLPDKAKAWEDLLLARATVAKSAALRAVSARRQRLQRLAAPYSALRAAVALARFSTGGNMLRKLAALIAAVAAMSLSGCGYNDLQRQDEGIKAAWSEVVNQYQRRADLVPNLVNTVEGLRRAGSRRAEGGHRGARQRRRDQGHARARQRSRPRSPNSRRRRAS